jgi:hypothetical protein
MAAAKSLATDIEWLAGPYVAATILWFGTSEQEA